MSMNMNQVIIRYPSFESLWVHSYEVLQQHLQHQASRILSCRGGRLLKDAWRNCSSPEAWIAWMAWAVKKFSYQGISMGICYVHRCAIVSQDVLRCIKMNAMKKLNCTLKSVTKVCAQVVLFLAVLAWCSSVLKRRKIDSSIQIQTYPTYQAQRLPETGLWICLDHPNSVSTQVRIIYVVFLNNFYDELEDEAREVEAGALVGLKSHASVLPWHCPEALARAAESKVEEAEHMMEMGLVRPPMIRHVGPQGPHGPQGPQGRHAMESAMEREPSHRGWCWDWKSPRSTLFFGLGDIKYFIGFMIVKKQLQWSSRST